MQPSTHSSVGSHPKSAWVRTPIRQIEDLSDAVHGAGMNAVQLSRTSVSGTIVHLAHDGILLSSGRLENRVEITGPLSNCDLGLALGLDLPADTRLWLREVQTGTVGVFRPGDDHDAIHGARSFYLAATVNEERLLIEAEQQKGLVIDPDAIRHTGVHPRLMAPRPLAAIRSHFLAAHRGEGSRTESTSIVADVLAAFIEHFGRPPRQSPGIPSLPRHEQIVAKARDYIHAYLDGPIHIDDVARAACVSRRTLCRAFAKVMDESPRSYILRLRLHRIRADLSTEAEVRCTVALVANRWGVGELGRLAGRYKTLFGELPSVTLYRARIPG